MENSCAGVGVGVRDGYLDGSEQQNNLVASSNLRQHNFDVEDEIVVDIFFPRVKKKLSQKKMAGS